MDAAANLMDAHRRDTVLQQFARERHYGTCRVSTHADVSSRLSEAGSSSISTADGSRRIQIDFQLPTSVCIWVCEVSHKRDISGSIGTIVAVPIEGDVGESAQYHTGILVERACTIRYRTAAVLSASNTKAARPVQAAQWLFDEVVCARRPKSVVNQFITQLQLRISMAACCRAPPGIGIGLRGQAQHFTCQPLKFPSSGRISGQLLSRERGETLLVLLEKFLKQ